MRGSVSFINRTNTFWNISVQSLYLSWVVNMFYYMPYS